MNVLTYVDFKLEQEGVIDIGESSGNHEIIALSTMVVLSTV